MVSQSISATLKKHQIRPTAIRETILKLLSDKNHALSHSDIEDSLNNESDRVTIYRTLNTFVESGLIHKILDQNGVTKFALCHESCSPTHHVDEHFHFQCRHCHRVYCIENMHLPEIKFPHNFVVSELHLKAEGFCPDCQNERK